MLIYKWNATGTVLTVSDDDGVVRMYKGELAATCL